MQQQRGNFLLQALLALGVIFAFVPFVTRQLSGRNTDARMYTSARQVDIAHTAARIFVRENANNLPFDTTVVSGNDFSDLLEPYGLPLGYVPRTALGQNIALVINKTPVAVSAYLELTGGDLSEIERTELARRIGFYASPTDVGVNVGVELTDVYSDIVRRNEPSLENSGFLTDLDMGGFALNSVGNLFAVRGEFDGAEFNTLSITGVESGKKIKNNIELMLTPKTVFQSKDGSAAFSISRGTLRANSLNGRTLSMFGDAGNLTVNDAAAYELAMSAGHTSFVGPTEWNVRGNLVSDHISFSVERLDVSSYISATRGQDVFIDYDTLEYNSKSGIEVGTLKIANITMRDQTSSALDDGGSGAVILDVRPAGTGMLPDVLVSDIDNNSFAIIADASSDDADTVDCEKIITDMEMVYEKQSLAQNLICQYVYWQRLEHRIDIKQCLMAGRSDCK